MTIADRTPSPYTGIDDENYVDTDRWSCREENGGSPSPPNRIVSADTSGGTKH
ncbi:hypothetical protein [Propionibacterium acidifaciens]|uniref:hypothetical protein n=1 Tax=Propionibacterium acidifaciens TaxID=556499 RepID=UPI0036115F82